MDFRVLGPLEVSENGRPLTPSRAKQRALLGLLLMRPNQQVPMEDLVEALWGEAPPDSARTAVHGHISALRKLLGNDRIRTDAAGYVLRLDTSELDAGRFEQLVGEASGVHEPSGRARLLRSALDLWRGDPLNDLHYEGLVEPGLARLQQLRHAALERRIEAELELGLHAELVLELEQLVAADPLHESFRSQLMLALYRSGRQAEALRVYEDGRRALSAELGIDPSAILQRLHQQILNRDPALDRPVKAASVPRQARKIVTVLVIELVPAGPIDPEDLERRVDPLLERCRAHVARFGATVQPLFSNALVAVFGAARAHEDDPERAIRAAIALRDELSSETAFVLRVGVDSGPALVTVEGDRVDVTGAVLSDASQLQAGAPPGGIVVGQHAHRATQKAIDYEPYTVDAHLARGARRSVPAFEVPLEEIPFVGRRIELSILEGTFLRASEGDAQLVTISGEPGSGKSRLTRELRGRIESRFPHQWREGRCLPYGDGVTFWALGEIVKGQAGILESDSPETSIDKLRSSVGTLFDEGADRSWVESALAPLVGISTPTAPAREQSFAAWRRFLEAIASREPLIMLIEDIHWADPALVEFIEHVVDETASVPFMVICTARLEFFDAHPSWGGGRHSATSIVLPPLDHAGTEELFEAILGRAPSPSLVNRSGGNPLFAQELARMVAASPHAEHVVPETVHSVIAARLDTLSPEVRDAATYAAVMGEVFWAGAVAAIGAIEQTEAEERLRPLVRGQFVRRSRTSSVTGQAEYAFVHALVRDVAYDAIPVRKRASLHQLAARWIEELAGDRVSDHAEFVAYHYRSALELVRAAGLESIALEAKTREYLVLAGDRAMRLDVGKAERCYRFALGFTRDEDPHRAGVLARLGSAAQEAGRLREALSWYEEAIASFESGGDWLNAARALMELSRALWRIGDTDRHRAAIDQAVRLLEPHPLGADLVRAWMLKGRDLEHAGQAEESLPWTERALQSADEVGRPDIKVWSLQYRGIARKHLGDARAVEDLEDALRLGLELGLGIETAICYSNLGDFVSAEDGPAAGMRTYQEGIEFSSRRGLVHNVMWIRSNLPNIYFELGDWDAALREVDEVLGWDLVQGTSQISMFVLAVKVQILVSRGAIHDAAEPAQQLVALARRIGDLQAIIEAMAPAAVFELARGNPSAAVGLVKEIEVRTRGLPGWRSHRIADCVRVCVAAGDLELAESLLNGAGTNLKRRVGSVLAARAAVAEGRGDLERAGDLYREARAFWIAFGHRPEQAYALLGEGRCAAALGRRRDSNEAFGAARAILGGLGALALMQTAH